MDNPDNNGLAAPIADLQNIVTLYSLTMSRADIWVLAALTASETQQNAGGRGGNNNNGPVLPFNMEFVGRATCNDPTGNGVVREMPSAHLTTQGLRKFFEDEFGFNDVDTTAIMGAHTL